MRQLIQINEVDDVIVTTIKHKLTYQEMGLIVCDLVRHITNAHGCDEDDVWEWVDKERYHHTTEIARAN